VARKIFPRKSVRTRVVAWSAHFLFLSCAPMSGFGDLAGGAPHWRQAVDRITRESDFWAAGVMTTMTVYNGTDELLGSVETNSELELTEGRPVWNQKSRIRKGKPGMTFTMDLGLQETPGVILKEYDSWTLLRKEFLEGSWVQVWKGVESGKPDNTATAYLDESTAWPRQIIFTVPFKSLLLGIKSFTMIVEYKATAEGAWLPSRAIIDQSGRVIFMKRRVHIESEYHGWRPATTIPPGIQPTSWPPATNPAEHFPRGN
jgi:hypothetical protein